MTLPFEKPENPLKTTRKYQCFCCGILLSDLETYKSHLLENHEEGRDYIICPLKHCGYPVRDIRSHFACKHIGTPVPPKGAMKASVWKDFNAKGEKKVTRKPKFREGWYDSTKMQKQLHYRSGLECSFYEYLDQDFDVLSYGVEPFEVPYIHQGKSHDYTPDLIVHFRNGKTEVWEIKPSSQTLFEKNQDKWRACHQACKNRGWEFIVMTETGRDKLKLKVMNQKALNRQTIPSDAH